MKIDRFAKAIIAAVISGLSALMGALTSGDGTWDSVDAEAWVGAAIAALTALAAVYFVPNTAANLPPDAMRAPAAPPPEPVQWSSSNVLEPTSNPSGQKG